MIPRNTPEPGPILGENDLFSPRLLRFPWRTLLAPLLLGLLALIAGCGIIGVALLRQLTPDSGITSQSLSQTRTTAPADTSNDEANQQTPPVTAPLPATFTPPPTVQLATVTPTASPTPTETPCTQVVSSGDTLTSLAYACGHLHNDVIALIVEMNGLASADTLQIGQSIEIPWPTPTTDPNAAATNAQSALSGVVGETAIAEGEINTGDEALDAILSEFVPEAMNAEPTLPPGVMWYSVQSGDNILSIAIDFDANVRILSELNPEVTFSQCDFGLDSGGGSCIVNLFEGQQIRVPAPTPTPTLSPTPSGSETPTPTPTPTFNAPALYSPGDRAHFASDAIITLRWVTTGTLEPGDVYLLTVTDATSNTVYAATTTDTLFILPTEWQPGDGRRHTFQWQLAVGPEDNEGRLASVTFATVMRTFTWDSR